MGADLTAVDRAVLADRLHNLDPRWQPPRALGLPLAAKAMPEKGSDQGARVSVTCGACGAPFTAHRSTARYCSATCRQRAQRARQPHAARLSGPRNENRSTDDSRDRQAPVR
jgi:hypothetical protein